MNIANLGIDVTEIDRKTSEDIQESYARMHARLTEEGAPLEKILRITTSFHEVMKRKNESQPGPLVEATATEVARGTSADA